MVVPKPAPRVSWLLVFAGLVLLGLCVLAVFRQQDTLAGALAALGLGAILVAALAPRLSGQLEIGPSGIKANLEKLTATGRAGGYSAEEILAVIENRLSSQDSTGLEPAATKSPDKPTPAEPARQVLASWPLNGEDDEHAVDQINLAISFRDRYLRSGEAGDLARALETARRAAEDTPPGSPYRPTALDVLGEILLEQFQQSGEPAVLDQAVEALQAALAASPTGSPQYQAAIRSLASAVQFRFQRTGELADQDRAIALLQELEAARRSR